MGAAAVGLKGEFACGLDRGHLCVVCLKVDVVVVAIVRVVPRLWVILDAGPSQGLGVCFHDSDAVKDRGQLPLEEHHHHGEQGAVGVGRGARSSQRWWCNARNGCGEDGGVSGWCRGITVSRHIQGTVIRHLNVIVTFGMNLAWGMRSGVNGVGLARGPGLVACN